MIILAVIFILWLLWPVISRWFGRFMANRAEDMMRRMMGMPTRKEERRRQSAKSGSEYRGRTRSDRSGQRNSGKETDPAVEMQNVAVDVEYTEYIEYESEEINVKDDKRIRYEREEQVSDVEYVEVKRESQE